MSVQTFLLAFTITSSIAIVTLARPKGKSSAVALYLCMIMLNVAISAIVSIATPNENIVFRTLTLQSIKTRDAIAQHFVAVSLGLTMGMTLTKMKAGKSIKILAVVGYLASILGASIICSKEKLSEYLQDSNATGATGLIVSEIADGWSIQKIANLKMSPTAIAVGPNDNILVCGYVGNYQQTGAVLSITRDGTKQNVSTLARGLTRPHGIAIHEGVIYVSRSGQYAKAVAGRLVQEPTGAVTRLADLDKDGNYEILEDIVTGLPGAQLPDGLHTNNNITVSQDGHLFITVGSPTDHAPPQGKLDGTILKCGLDGKDLEVYARGLRNPFGICFGSNGDLYCSDNDSNRESPGDKICQIQKDAHYGHPFDAIPNVSVEGVTEPLIRMSSAQGLACIPANAGTPNDNQILVASFGDDAINAIEVAEGNSAPKAKVKFLARVPGVVAVCCDTVGTVYACSYTERAIYRLSPIR